MAGKKRPPAALPPPGVGDDLQPVAAAAAVIGVCRDVVFQWVHKGEIAREARGTWTPYRRPVTFVSLAAVRVRAAAYFAAKAGREEKARARAARPKPPPPRVSRYADLEPRPSPAGLVLEPGATRGVAFAAAVLGAEYEARLLELQRRAELRLPLFDTHTPAGGRAEAA